MMNSRRTSSGVRTSPGRLGALFAVLVLTIGLGAAPSAPANAAGSPHQLRVLEHNIAGGPTFRGDPAALKGVNAQITAFGPDVVMLDEVCASQRDAFQQQHPAWHVYFSVMASNQRSCQVEGSSNIRQGQMLASPYPIANISNDNLGYEDVSYYADGEKRTLYFKLLCGDIAIPGHSATGLRACVTHLRAGHEAEDDTAREGQTSKIRSLLHSRIWDDGQAVTVGGDFNAVPSWKAMNSLYQLTTNGTYTGSGDFHEADQTDPNYFSPRPSGVTCASGACRTGQKTYGKSSKIDHVFISRNVTHKGRVSGMAADQYGSDHHVYRALFEIQY